MKKLTLAFLAALTIMVSCKKDDDKGPDDSPALSRTIRYEITGNFTGTLYAPHTTASGGTANDQVAALPWNKEITYSGNVAAAVIAVIGNGGVAGQKITVIVKRGGTQVGTPMVAEANSSGAFSQSAPVIVF